jgi:hypothetical protein
METGVIFGEEASQLCRFVHPVVTSSLGANIFLSTLFVNTLSSSCRERDHIPHPHKIGVSK